MPFVKRDDGKCCRCECKPAETFDGLFCLPCLHAQVRHDTPIPSHDDDDDSYSMDLVAFELQNLERLHGE